MTHLMNLIVEFFRSKTGNAAIEFAITGPVFLLLILGVFQVGFILIIQNALDEACYEGSRYAETGYAGSTGSRSASIEQVIKNAVQNFSLGLADPTQVSITTNIYPTLNNVTKSAPLGTGYGGPGQVVQYQVSYNWNSIIQTLSSNPNILLSGNTIVTNEIF